MANHYTKNMMTGRITKVEPKTYTPDPERADRIKSDADTVKRHARKAAFANDISRSEYDGNTRMRASWEKRAVRELTSTGVSLHPVVILAYA